MIVTFRNRDGSPIEPRPTERLASSLRRFKPDQVLELALEPHDRPARSVRQTLRLALARADKQAAISVDEAAGILRAIGAELVAERRAARHAAYNATRRKVAA